VNSVFLACKNSDQRWIALDKQVFITGSKGRVSRCTMDQQACLPPPQTSFSGGPLSAWAAVVGFPPGTVKTQGAEGGCDTEGPLTASLIQVGRRLIGPCLSGFHKSALFPLEASSPQQRQR